MTKKIVIRGLKLTALSVVLVALETICATIVYIRLMNTGLPRNIDISFVSVLLLMFSLLCLRVIPTHFLDLETESKETLWKTSVDVITALTHRFFSAHTRGNIQQKPDESLDRLYIEIGKAEIVKEEKMDKQEEVIELISTAMASTSTHQREEKKQTLSQEEPEKNLCLF